MSMEIKLLRVEKLRALEYLCVIINTGRYKKKEYDYRLDSLDLRAQVALVQIFRNQCTGNYYIMFIYGASLATHD